MQNVSVYLHSVHRPTIMRPANEELTNVDIDVYLEIPMYKNVVGIFTSACRDVIFIRHVHSICAKGGRRSVGTQGLILASKQNKNLSDSSYYFLEMILKQTKIERNGLQRGLAFSKLMLGPHLLYLKFPSTPGHRIGF